ncbi:MAG: Holliday junction branch migration protein RuvA [Bacilli bacterium]|nr:Holliday junction branch migration protein RuvA [Bacilli bacterium]MCQ2794474.1 Holliday junction branch migration protein RuvA [Bacilli bacterium]
MYYSLKGKITQITTTSIVIDVHDVSYEVMVAHPNSFNLNEETTVYTHYVIREDEQYLVGFKSLDEKKAFMSLINVKGIGPKTALNALSGTSTEELFNAIAANNITFLKKLPGIGTKAASQIILDLKGSLTSAKADIHQYEQVRTALKGLGFKVKEIEDALAQVNIPNGTNEMILKEALRKLRK